jgi:predicted phosphodiesterase
MLVISDLHCGHNLGLTPASWQRKQHKISELQALGYDWFLSKLKPLGKIDILLVNGDAIDGPGRKDSAEHLTTDIEEQQNISIEIIKTINAKKTIMTRGTGYHVKTDCELENRIAEVTESQIENELKFSVNDVIFHARHTTGKGGTAYGSITSGQRSAIVTMLNDIEADNVKADIFIRSHIHEYSAVDRDLYKLFITPCLQFKGTTYGRGCTGFYSYGFLYFEIKDRDNIFWKREKLLLTNGRKESIIKL